MSADVVVADCGFGNMGAALGAWRSLGYEVTRSSDPATLARARLLVVPGVGHLGAVLRELRQRGVAEVIAERDRRGQATLGVCVGMQALFEGGEEAASEAGLGLLEGWVVAMTGAPRLPEMQWNVVSVVADAPPPLRVLDGAWVYFVHSYAVATTPHALATEEFGGRWVAAAGRDALLGVQFHPERSGRRGLAFLDALFRWVRTEA